LETQNDAKQLCKHSLALLAAIDALVNHIYDKTTPKEFPRPGMGVYDESTYEEHLQSDGAHLTWPTIIQRLCSPIPKKRDNVKANLKIISQPSSKKQKKKEEAAKPFDIDEAFAIGVGKWTCDKLRAYLKDADLPTNGKKAVLIARIMDNHRDEISDTKKPALPTLVSQPAPKKAALPTISKPAPMSTPKLLPQAHLANYNANYPSSYSNSYYYPTNLYPDYSNGYYY
jgi:hypothetical protein